jgi:hypothetical protein
LSLLLLLSLLSSLLLQAAAEGDAAGSDELQLNQAQLAEYHRLKDTAGTATSKLTQDRATEQAQLQVGGWLAGCCVYCCTVDAWTWRVPHARGALLRTR